MIARLNAAAAALSAAMLLASPLTPAVQAQPWRSALYPADWKPGFTDGQGRFLHDFSYAGYHRGEIEIPRREGEVIDVTAAPYSADPTGKTDATAAIQAALDAAAAKGGGIVFLPAGTYSITPPEGKDVALRVEGDNLVLRGAGVDKTFLVNQSYVMRNKTVISVKAANAAWWVGEAKGGNFTKASSDIPGGSKVIPLEDVTKLKVGDAIVLRNEPTEEFIAELGMTGKWSAKNLKNRALVFLRRVTAIHEVAKTIAIDVPTRYDLKTRDNAMIVKMGGKLITETGLEDFSLGMKEHPGEGWGEDDQGVEGTAAYDVHQSHAIVFESAENCWMRRVNSFAPEGNAPSVHILSNGVKFGRSRNITFTECDWRHAQYKGGGGNGYLYTFHGNDCLIRDSRAEAGRHNFDFGFMSSTGNVIHNCYSKDGRLGSDFHMLFSVANLFDNVTCDGDFLEARYRPFGGSPVHGVTTSQTVFWNTKGERYTASPFEFNGKMHDRPQVLIWSEQFGNGYVIGTRGPANKVKSSNFVEGAGKGDTLEPASLYADQLKRRLGK
jgi:hypothetical protein